MLIPYLVAFSGMAIAVCAILVIRATVDQMWHLGE